MFILFSIQFLCVCFEAPEGVPYIHPSIITSRGAGREAGGQANVRSQQAAAVQYIENMKIV
jgi:hypothetical protein